MIPAGTAFGDRPRWEEARSAWELDCHASLTLGFAGKPPSLVVREWPSSTGSNPHGHATGTFRCVVCARGCGAREVYGSCQVGRRRCLRADGHRRHHRWHYRDCKPPVSRNGHTLASRCRLLAPGHPSPSSSSAAARHQRLRKALRARKVEQLLRRSFRARFRPVTVQVEASSRGPRASVRVPDLPSVLARKWHGHHVAGRRFTVKKRLTISLGTGLSLLRSQHIAGQPPSPSVREWPPGTTPGFPSGTQRAATIRPIVDRPSSVPRQETCDSTQVDTHHAVLGEQSIDCRVRTPEATRHWR